MQVTVQELDLGRSRDGAKGFASILFSRTETFRFTGPAGRLRTAMASFPGSGLRFGGVASSGHEIRLDEPAFSTFLLPLQGQVDVQHGRADWLAGAGSVLAVPPGPRSTAVAAPGAGAGSGDFEAAFAMATPGWLDRLSEAGGLSRPRGGGSARGLLDPAAAAGLARKVVPFAKALLAGRLSAEGRQTRALEALLRDVLFGFLEAASLRPDGRSGLVELRVRQAEEIIRARAEGPLSMTEVAEALGVGLRSLQIAFQSLRGHGPREYLNRVRLDAARRLLAGAGPETSVTMVALDCGFTHLGRFAEAYRSRFGEKPSDTLGRARGWQRPEGASAA